MRIHFDLISLSVLLMGARSTQAADAASQNSRASDSQAKTRLEEYVTAVTHGAGFLPWQARGISEKEQTFRSEIESRKDRLLASRADVVHPVSLTDAQLAQARRNIKQASWAAGWFRQQKELADYVAEQDDGYVERMIPELTASNSYGFTCPNCVGKKSQEAVGWTLLNWDYHHPEVCSCRVCGQEYPSEAYPETARLVFPRSDQNFTYYVNDQEQAHPDDRSGKYAWHWVGYPIHVSFTGVIREQKVLFMMKAVQSLALLYRMTGQDRYAKRTIEILDRLAHCYRHWLYHDYWDTIADCDPMYAAWHDHDLPLEWKRHLCGQAYKGDSFERAGMLQSYWGAGRIHSSTDAVSGLAGLAAAYDMVYNAADENGRSLWNPEQRKRVERDLILEYVMGAEPFVGGAGQATTINNKAPSIYHAQAAVARCLGLTALADTALRGYEAVRDQSFLFDGFSRESPSYTNMFLGQLVQVPEELNGFSWPAGFAARQGTVDLYHTDPHLRLMFRAMIDQLRPDGRYAPLSDTTAVAAPSSNLVEIGLHRYPEYYTGTIPALSRDQGHTEYAIFNLDAEEIGRDTGLNLPEVFFPAWMTAFLRHGRGPQSSMLTFSFCPPGNHRHDDNLSLFYIDRGQTILGDHGYVGDMPLNEWIRSSFSHNLVTVDNKEQQYHGARNGRKPSFRQMFTSPEVSLVEAASDVYSQCRDYRRLVALIKGPRAQTFAVDIFRVKGGDRHDFRVFSELAASDVAEGRLAFDGLSMPPEPPLPQVGASLKHEDIFGLRNVRGVDHPPVSFQAIWQEPQRRYRLWMLTPADRVEASNGPGQEIRNRPGRRVRYLDVLREGKNLESIFVAIHEPSGLDDAMVIQKVERLDLPASAGPDAVAIRIDSAWGTYLVLSEFAELMQVAGVRFRGTFGILHRSPNGQRWLLASGAETFTADHLGFQNMTATWSGKITTQTQTQFKSDTSAPDNWPTAPPGFTPYVLVHTNAGTLTGFPVSSVDKQTISVDRFPLPASSSFTFESIRFLTEKLP